MADNVDTQRGQPAETSERQLALREPARHAERVGGDGAGGGAPAEPTAAAEPSTPAEPTAEPPAADAERETSAPGQRSTQPDTGVASSRSAEVDAYVPTGLRIAAAFSWRFLLIVAALAVVVAAVSYLSLLAISLSVALLLAALMNPAVRRISRGRMPRPLGGALVFVGGLAALSGLITFVVIQFTDGLPAMQRQVTESLDAVQQWLTQGPLALDFENVFDQAITFIQENQEAITTQALTTAGVIGSLLTGIVLTLVILLFFLIHGDRIWAFLVLAAPGYVRDKVDRAARDGFESLSKFVQATAIVAVVDAVGIGLGLWIVGTPLVIPLATLVFLGAFIPIIGAVVTGAVAVLITLVTVGWVGALIILGVVIGVQQLESNILHPLLMGRAVRLHPLAVLLAITAGVFVAGIAGALLAVPLLAVINAGVKSLMRDGAAEPERLPKLARKLRGEHTGDGAHATTEDSTGEPAAQSAAPQDPGGAAVREEPGAGQR